jgi:hypothetical protein
MYIRLMFQVHTTVFRKTSGFLIGILQKWIGIIKINKNRDL